LNIKISYKEYSSRAGLASESNQEVQIGLVLRTHWVWNYLHRLLF